MAGLHGGSKEAETAAPAKNIDLNEPAVKKTIDEDQAVLKDGKSNVFSFPIGKLMFCH